jgi:type II secretory pathway pseudopilin PulG
MGRRVATRARTARRPPGDEAGFGLVEVMVAAFVLMVALGALAHVVMNTMVSIGDSRQRQQATALANRALEEARGVPFERLAMRTGHATVPGTTYDPDGTGPLGAEPVIRTADGAIAVPPFHATSSNVSIATYVTGPVAGTTDGRRVTVRATWPRRALAPGELRLSTIVTPLDRGLPAPDFEVTPLEGVSQAPPGATTCFSHTIRNRGFSDRYALALPTVSGYVVRAYEDRDDDGQPDGDELLTDTTGDGSPNTPGPLEPNETTRVLVCYQPTSTGNADFSGIEAVVRSVYDGSVSRTLVHRHEVRSGINLYLHDVNNTAHHTRASPALLPMSATPSTRSTLFNYSTNLDLLYPGMQIKKGDTSSRVEWTHQFPAATTLGGAVELRFWSAWKDAIDPAQNKSDPKTMQYQVRLLKVSGPTTTSLLTNTISYSHAQAGWVRLDHTTTLPTTPFAQNDRIRLELDCLGGSADDCHVAYDTVPHLARLYVAQP